MKEGKRNGLRRKNKQKIEAKITLLLTEGMKVEFTIL